jgi:hypothetical protein
MGSCSCYCISLTLSFRTAKSSQVLQIACCQLTSSGVLASNFRVSRFGTATSSLAPHVSEDFTDPNKVCIRSKTSAASGFQSRMLETLSKDPAPSSFREVQLIETKFVCCRSESLQSHTRLPGRYRRRTSRSSRRRGRRTWPSPSSSGTQFARNLTVVCSRSESKDLGSILETGLFVATRSLPSYLRAERLLTESILLFRWLPVTSRKCQQKWAEDSAVALKQRQAVS